MRFPHMIEVITFILPFVFIELT